MADADISRTDIPVKFYDEEHDEFGELALIETSDDYICIELEEQEGDAWRVVIPLTSTVVEHLDSALDGSRV